MHTDTHSERDAADSESNDRKYKLKNIYIFKRCLKINAIHFICFNFDQFIQLQQSCIHSTRNHESTFIHCANASQMNAHLLPNSVWNFAVPNRRFFFTNINHNEWISNCNFFLEFHEPAKKSNFTNTHFVTNLAYLCWSAEKSGLIVISIEFQRRNK